MNEKEETEIAYAEEKEGVNNNDGEKVVIRETRKTVPLIVEVNEISTCFQLHVFSITLCMYNYSKKQVLNVNHFLYNLMLNFSNAILSIILLKVASIDLQFEDNELIRECPSDVTSVLESEQLHRK